MIVLDVCYIILTIEGILHASLVCLTSSIHTSQPPIDIKWEDGYFPLAIDPNTLEAHFCPTPWVVTLWCTGFQNLPFDMCRSKLPSLPFGSGLKWKYKIMNKSPIIFITKIEAITWVLVNFNEQYVFLQRLNMHRCEWRKNLLDV